MIVEWGCADSALEVARYLMNLPDKPWSRTGIVLDLPAGRGTLLWAAERGDQL